MNVTVSTIREPNKKNTKYYIGDYYICNSLFPQLSSQIMTAQQQQEVFDYAKINLIKLSIYIKDPYISKYVTEEKITEIAFVGTVGGIIGLFLGFSFISAAEVIYMFGIKMIKNEIKMNSKPVGPIEVANPRTGKYF